MEDETADSQDQAAERDSAPTADARGSEWGIVAATTALVARVKARVKAHPIWGWGLLGGGGATVLGLLQVAATLAAPKFTVLAGLLFLGSIAVYSVAGYRAARQVNTQVAGALAGLVAGAVAGVAIVIVEVVLVSRGTAGLVPASLHLSFREAAIYLLERVLLDSAALGVVGGALGGVIGRK